MASDERYIETLQVGDEAPSRREGTLAELGGEPATPKRPRLRAGGASVDDVIKVLNLAWTIIKDTKAEASTSAACTRVLSPKDDNWANYAHARNFLTAPITFKLDNFMGVNCFTVTFRLAGSCAARHPTIGGDWIPNAHVTFAKCEANWPWIVNGQAAIDTTYVTNLGSVEAPIPQVVLSIKIKADAKFIAGWESHERTFEFNLDGRDGARLIPA